MNNIIESGGAGDSLWCAIFCFWVFLLGTNLQSAVVEEHHEGVFGLHPPEKQRGRT